MPKKMKPEGEDIKMNMVLVLNKQEGDQLRGIINNSIEIFEAMEKIVPDLIQTKINKSAVMVDPETSKKLIEACLGVVSLTLSPDNDAFFDKYQEAFHAAGFCEDPNCSYKPKERMSNGSTN